MRTACGRSGWAAFGTRARTCWTRARTRRSTSWTRCRRRSAHYMRRHVLRHALDLELALLLRFNAVGVAELLEQRLGYEDRVGLGVLGQPRGDVHVDAQVVAADLARLADVQAGAQLRLVAVALDLAEVVAAFLDRLKRLERLGEHRHHPVAQPLDHAAAAVGYRRLHPPGGRRPAAEPLVRAGGER